MKCLSANWKHGLLVLLPSFLSVFSLNGLAQLNLVPNPSFEQYTDCPSNKTIYDYKNSKPSIWYKPDSRDAGYCNSCGDSVGTGVPLHESICVTGYQPARTGSAYVGMFFLNGTNQRNYFQVELTDSLRKGRCYYAEYYVSLFNCMGRPCNNQSMLFTAQAVYADTVPAGKNILLASPQVTNFGNPIIYDTVNWVKVSGIFAASGGEQFLTIGNFRNDAMTSYTIVNGGQYGYYGAAYYVDDVSVIPLDSMPLPADAGPDRTITLGDSTYIGSYTSGINIINWYNSSGAQIASGVPGLKVSPAASTFYVVEHTVCGNYSRDTVYVTVQAPVPLSFLSYNATLQDGNIFHRWATGNEVNVSHYNITRSNDGSEFKEVGTMKAGLINGQYSFIEHVEAKANAWYRIEGVDYDGKKTYSNIINLKNLGERKVLLMPNPVRDVLTVSGEGLKNVQIIDVNGKVVIKRSGNGSVFTINTESLPTGVYVARVMTADGRVETHKIIKQ